MEELWAARPGRAVRADGEGGHPVPESDGHAHRRDGPGDGRGGGPPRGGWGEGEVPVFPPGRAVAAAAAARRRHTGGGGGRRQRRGGARGGSPTGGTPRLVRRWCHRRRVWAAASLDPRARPPHGWRPRAGEVTRARAPAWPGPSLILPPPLADGRTQPPCAVGPWLPHHGVDPAPRRGSGDVLPMSEAGASSRHPQAKPSAYRDAQGQPDAPRVRPIRADATRKKRTEQPKAAPQPANPTAPPSFSLWQHQSSSSLSASSSASRMIESSSSPTNRYHRSCVRRSTSSTLVGGS